jgi:hypothetical protein
MLKLEEVLQGVCVHVSRLLVLVSVSMNTLMPAERGLVNGLFEGCANVFVKGERINKRNIAIVTKKMVAMVTEAGLERIVAQSSQLPHEADRSW